MQTFTKLIIFFAAIAAISAAMIHAGLDAAQPTMGMLALLGYFAYLRESGSQPRK